MNLKIARLLLNAKCEIVVFTQCSRQWLLNYDNQNIVHLVAYIYMLISNEEISKIADLHVAVIWLQLPEFLSTFLYYLNFEVPEGFK